jgi:hypothetical protein
MVVHGRRPAVFPIPLPTEASMHPVPNPARRAPGESAPVPRTVDLTSAPIAVPDGAHGVLVTAVDAEPGGVLEGQWIFDPDWSALRDEDVVATIGACHAHSAERDGMHLEAYLVHDGRVLRLGSWCGLGAAWPEPLRHPAAAAMSLHTALLEAGHECAPRITT